MTLYTNESYMDHYTSVVQLESEEILFFQVALQTNNTFASDVLLQVDSCWATESRNPDDAVQGVLLQDGFVNHFIHCKIGFSMSCRLLFYKHFDALFYTTIEQPLVIFM